MAIQDCIAEIKQAAGRDDMTDDEVMQIMETLDKRAKKKAAVSSLKAYDEHLRDAAAELADETKTAAIIEKRNQALNVLRKAKREAFYGQFEGQEAKGISILNVGSERPVAGYGASVDAQSKAIERDLMGPMIAELRAANLLDLVSRRNPDLERDIARDMWELTAAEVEGRTANLTGAPEAQGAAKILTKYQEAARLMQNDAGAWIGKLPGWIARQSHDMFKLRRAGFEAWRDTILPRLDPEKTFGDIDDVDGFLRAAYNGVSSGEHYREQGASDWLGGFKGPANIAKKASQERVLHFKSADDWMAYNDAFGAGGLIDSVFYGMHRAAKNTALMRTWGTNPRAAFAADLEQLRQNAAKRGDPKAVDNLRSWRLTAEFDELDGTAGIPGNPTWARNMAFTRAGISLSSLGGVLLSSIPDIAYKAATLKHNGVGFLEGYGNALGDLMRGRAKGEQRVIADYLGAGYDGLLGTIHARFSAADTPAGKMARAQNWFFKVNGFQWWLDGKSTGTGLMLSHHLARNVDKAFDGLDPELRTSLERYGIGEKQWAALRQAETRLDGDTAYMMPDAVNLLPDDVIAPLATGKGEKAMQRARDDLRIALRTFYTDTVEAVNTNAGARQRAIATFGTRPGTPLGEAVRFVMQYKLFSITAAQRHIGREWFRPSVPGWVHLVVATTGLGYLAMSAKDLAKGRTPRDPTDPKTWAAAMQQGGGLGIYGDFLFGEYNRFGGGALETLAGPAVGKASQLLRSFSTLKEGEFEAAGAQLAKFGVDNVPGINLFYTKAAVDYLILFQFQEFLNPGYLRRMERRIAKDNGQAFIVPPSSTIPYGGGSRLFEGVR